LDAARVHFLLSKDATNNRIQNLAQIADKVLREAIDIDKREAGEDEYEGFQGPEALAPNDIGPPFVPYGDHCSGWGFY
jgi:hypothetical protein